MTFESNGRLFAARGGRKVDALNKLLQARTELGQPADVYGRQGQGGGLVGRLLNNPELISHSLRT